MNWNKHPEINGQHAFLSPSKYTWMRKSDDELVDSYYASYVATIGTLLHALAEDHIRLRRELTEYDIRSVEFELLRHGIPSQAFNIDFLFPTVMSYINDSIAYHMDAEVPLKYSDKCFGTADAIQFRRKKLRIHDLKTGLLPAKIDQLMSYAALFFLEYGHKPENVSTELRIYQAGDILVCEPLPEEIREVMETIVHADAVVQSLKEE